MTPPRLFRAYAKINLGLEVLGRRPDGYHEVRTVLQTISIFDTLEVTPAPDGISLECSDPRIPSGEENIVVKAARLLRDAAGVRAGAKIRLTKRIPSQAGLGGGSSDGAMALLALSRLWNIAPGRELLMSLAERLGSDVPFFLCGGTALCAGRGEEVYPLPDAPLSNLAIAWPPSGMATKEAYGILDEKLTSPRDPHRIQDIVGEVVSRRLTQKRLFNRFEEVAAHGDKAQEASSVKKALLAAGATRALMAGSGAAWVGFFSGSEEAKAGAMEVAREGFGAAAVTTLDRKAYWEQTLTGFGKELLP
jgi:4-diphosphocytidyl-2-C-methyl-D-erythritol kinase